MYQVLFDKPAAKQLAKLPKKSYEKVKKSIEELAENPRPVGCLKLKGNGDAYRIRIGDFRVIYEIEDDVLVVVVVSIGDRKEVYR
jgi:mRNA interferase RelE/StbE